MATALVVDDSKVNRDLLNALLKDMGHEVIAEAENGTSAFEKYRELQPDFVTMDVNMSNGDGITATENIIRFDPDARIIMISAVDNYHVKDSAILESRSKDYITKPIQKERLKNAIDNLEI